MYIFDASFVRVDQRDKMLRDFVVKIINNELILDNWSRKWKWSTRIWLTRKIYEFPIDMSENNDYYFIFDYWFFKKKMYVVNILKTQS